MLDKKKDKTPKLVVWPQRILYTGHYHGEITFNHIKDTLIVSLDHPMRVFDSTGDEVLSTSSLLVPKLFKGHLLLQYSHVIILSLDIMGYTRDLLLRNYTYFTYETYNPHSFSLCANFEPRETFLNGFNELSEMSSEPKLLNTHINSLVNPSSFLPKRRELDVRVLQTLKLARDCRKEKLLITDLASSLDLSESRLRHIFKKEMGYSLGLMLNSLRLLTFLEHFCHYGNMTYAAADAGFSDLSHLNKTMHKTIGLSFSKIMRHNETVLTAFCSH